MQILYNFHKDHHHKINKNLNKSKEQKKLIIYNFHKKRFQINKTLNKSN